MKPIKAKPQLYAHYFETLKKIAIDHGYALFIHGSMNRDLDLVAVPWQDSPSDEFEMVNAFCKYLTGKTYTLKEKFLFQKLPGNRHNYVIDLNRGGYKRTEDGLISDPIEFTPDPEYYIDLSIPQSIQK